MNAGLISQMFDDKERLAFEKLYAEDVDSRDDLKQAIGSKIVTEKDKIITSNLIDVLFLMCLTAKFASSEDECYRVAISVYQFHNKSYNDLLPNLMTDRGLALANKCLIALSFCSQALEKRWKFHGAPSPQYYRQISKTVFAHNKQNDIAEHHEQWEGFLGEITV